MNPGVIDVHAHIGRTIASDIGQTYLEFLKTMDAVNMRQAILSAAAGDRQAEGVEDTMRQNDAVAEAMRAYPDRFPVGLAYLEPRHQEKAVEELDRALTQLGMQGMAFHAMLSGFWVGRGHILDPIFDLANQREALCLMHCQPDSPDSMAPPTAIGELAARYPRVTIIMGHPTLTVQQRTDSIEAARRADNLYLDLAYQQDPENAEVTVRALGAERVLFGSDAPFFDPALTIRSIEAAHITDDARERVLYGNAAELVERFRRPRVR